MNDYEKYKINELLKKMGREDLKCDFLYKRDYNTVLEMLSLPYWNEVKFQSLLTSTIWLSNAKEIKAILKMPEWKEEKFQPLLTSTIWLSNSEEIKEILGMPEWNEVKFQPLLTSNIWRSNAKEVKEILEMSEWKEEKFQSLLTSNIWQSNAKEIKAILKMPEWKEEKYKHLLIPSIFCASTKNIRDNIELFKEYNIDNYIVNSCLRRNVKQQRVLLEYMIENNIPLFEEKKDGEYRLNTMISATNSVLKKKYGIDIKSIELKWRTR